MKLITIEGSSNIDAVARAAYETYSARTPSPSWDGLEGHERDIWRMVARTAAAMLASGAPNRHTKTKDIAGRKFGHWMALSYAGRGYWSCRCDCGTTAEVAGCGLRNGSSTKCKACQNATRKRFVHNADDKRLYKIRAGAIARCENPNIEAYPHYGGRGILMCPEWRANFLAFRSWALANGYAAHLTLERSDVDGNYCPDNCKWATTEEQGRNRRNNKKISYGGKFWFKDDLAAAHGLKPATLQTRLAILKWPLEKALREPVRGCNA